MRLRPQIVVSLALVTVAAGCELLVDFDRSKVDGGSFDASVADVAVADQTSPPVDSSAGGDAQADVAVVDGGTDAAVTADADASAPPADSGVDAHDAATGSDASDAAVVDDAAADAPDDAPTD